MTMSVRPVLAHPVALAALAMLLVNDHVLKSVAPGPVSGKLSDVAGLVIAPLLLAAVARAVLGREGRPIEATRLVLASAILIGLAFALVKTTPAGAVAWARGLGAAQWLLGGVWLRGEAPLPVEIVRDASDLLALPALALSVLVVRRPILRAGTTRLPARLIGPVLALVAGVACLATSQAQPTTTARASRQVGLDAENPAVAYRVTWSAKADSSGGELAASVPGGPLTVSIAPDGAFGADCVLVDGPATARLRLGDGCASVAGGSATVVVQAADPDGNGAGTLELSLLAYTADIAAASAATVAVAIDPEPVFAGRPSEAHEAAHGTLSIGTRHPEASARLVLVVDGDALRGLLAWPLLGRIRATAALGPDSTTTSPGPITIAVGEEETWIEPEQGAEVDWLELCRPKKPCRIPVTVTASWATHADIEPADPEATRDPEAGGGWATIAWSIDARLQAFDGRELPAGAVRLEKP